MRRSGEELKTRRRPQPPEDRRCPVCGAVKLETRRWSTTSGVCLSCARAQPKAKSGELRVQMERIAIMNRTKVERAMVLSGITARDLAASLHVATGHVAVLLSRPAVSAEVGDAICALTGLLLETSVRVKVVQLGRSVSLKTLAVKTDMKPSRLRSIEAGSWMTREEFAKVKEALKT